MPVYTTNLKTARVPHQAKWVTFRESRSCVHDAVTQLGEIVNGAVVWAFTDGSLAGYGAALVEPGKRIVKLAGREEMTGARNVSAELNGFLLALENLPVGARVVVVSDYLGVAAWMTGNWKIKNPEVRDRVERAKAIVIERELDLTFCHHAGHQKDDSDFTRYNNLADRLADGREQPGEVLLG